MDCDDVMLVLADARTLTAEHHRHIAGCASCQELAGEAQEEWRWLSRVHQDALDDRELLALPTIDPVVFDNATEIASGGMGRVLRAYDRRLGREVAIKETLSPGLRARFEREVKVTARLQHPAIVPVYEAGTFPDGSTFYTMRLVPGRNLHDAIGEASTLADRLRLMPHLRAVADALAYAHANHIIHRDLKPGNVLVGSFGETVVIDWGLARERDRPDDVPDAQPSLGPNLTRVGAVIGTPAFMSPAQAAGVPADATDDVYALGAMLYHLLAGHPPYYDTVESNSDRLIAATLDGPPTPLAQLAPDAPADLVAIAEHAMARSKRDRFPTAKELSEELARFEAGQLLVSRTYSLRELLMRWLARHRRAVIVAIAGLVALIAIAIIWTRYRRTAAELAIREHGAELTDLYSDVARQGARIDRQLLRLESGLEGLAAASSWALTGPEPSELLAPLYFDDDFADAARRPSDFTDLTSYRWPVSLEHLVFAVAPGTDRTAVLPKLRRLSPLRHHIRDMIVGTAIDDPSKLSDADRNTILFRRKSPIDYAYVLLPEGVIAMWPGIASLRQGYDPRTASYYRMSDRKRGKRWGAPYVDATTDPEGDDLVLPCTEGIWSPTGEFLGVAGVDITVTKLVDMGMTMTTRRPLRTSLVDGLGRKVIDSRDANKRFIADNRDEAVAFTDFDLPSIAAEIRAGEEGIRETTRDGHPIVVGFVKLDVIGWYYVVEVDAVSLGRPAGS